MLGLFFNYGFLDMMVFEGVFVLLLFCCECFEFCLQFIVFFLCISGVWYVYFVQFEGSVVFDLIMLCCIFEVVLQVEVVVEGVVSCIVVLCLGMLLLWLSKVIELVRGVGQLVSWVECGLCIDVQGWLVDVVVQQVLVKVLYDLMMQFVLEIVEQGQVLFLVLVWGELECVLVDQLEVVNQCFGLVMVQDEIDYLCECFIVLGWLLLDVELMMFVQVNFEYCCYKIFNVSWIIDGQEQDCLLFWMIKNIYQQILQYMFSVYSDNVVVIEGYLVLCYCFDLVSGEYCCEVQVFSVFQIKVEIYNYLIVIVLFLGVLIGVGGEICDEGVIGRGGKLKVGLIGFLVLYLCILELLQLWEVLCVLNLCMVLVLEIMIDGLFGGVVFNNEFGCLNLFGYFCSFELLEGVDLVCVYDKLIMLVGGFGVIDCVQVDKILLQVGDVVIVLGGLVMLIGLGGGVVSLVVFGESVEDLDFVSVQCDNLEMECCCQEVIDCCVVMGVNNLIKFFYDVGVGGLFNVIFELLYDLNVGGVIDLGKVFIDDLLLLLMQLWCNELQECYVLGVVQECLVEFVVLCVCECCLFVVVGVVIVEEYLVVVYGVVLGYILVDVLIDLLMDVLFGKLLKMYCDIVYLLVLCWLVLKIGGLDLQEVGLCVFVYLIVVLKNFLVIIGDCSVGGLIVCEQMVGLWQLLVVDVVIILVDFDGVVGEVMLIGECILLVLFDVVVLVCMVVGEVLINLCVVLVDVLDEIKLLVNWMVVVGYLGEDVLLYDVVKVVGMEFCLQLDISILVGKDLLLMQVQWYDQGEVYKSVLLVLLVILVFVLVVDVCQQLILLFDWEVDSELWLIGFGVGKQCLGGLILVQVYVDYGDLLVFVGVVLDLDDLQCLWGFFELICDVCQFGLLLVYYDCSDGGVFVVLCEMVFILCLGLDIVFDVWGDDLFCSLFNEELGVVVQIVCEDCVVFVDLVECYVLIECVQCIVKLIIVLVVCVLLGGENLVEWCWEVLFDVWWLVIYVMQKCCDNLVNVDVECEVVCVFNVLGLKLKFSFDFNEDVVVLFISIGVCLCVVVLCEQGVNGQIEMVNVFECVGFCVFDVYMSDLIEGCVVLQDFIGLVVCGGFSYGDVFGVGCGWVILILECSVLCDVFVVFFVCEDSFVLGVCNGCQMMSQLKNIILGVEYWLQFCCNVSEQFEVCIVLLEVVELLLILLCGMVGLCLQVVVVYGEGQVVFDNVVDQVVVCVLLCYIDGNGKVVSQYLLNLNGLLDGIIGLISSDGCVIIMMLYLECILCVFNLSWVLVEWQGDLLWMCMFCNVWVWCG